MHDSTDKKNIPCKIKKGSFGTELSLSRSSLSTRMKSGNIAFDEIYNLCAIPKFIAEFSGFRFDDLQKHDAIKECTKLFTLSQDKFHKFNVLCSIIYPEIYGIIRYQPVFCNKEQFDTIMNAYFKSKKDHKFMVEAINGLPLYVSSVDKVGSFIYVANYIGDTNNFIDQSIKNLASTYQPVLDIARNIATYTVDIGGVSLQTDALLLARDEVRKSKLSQQIYSREI